MSCCTPRDTIGTAARPRAKAIDREGRAGAWFQFPRSVDDACLELFCFPHAGSGASAYRDWPAHMPASVSICAVQLPGRESRFTEPALDSAESVVDALLPALTSRLGRRSFAFFGHSMGALLAFETAMRLQRLNLPGPVRLLVSGCGAPHLPDRGPPLKGLADDAFVAELRRMNGMPREILSNAELLEVLLPVLRADTALCEDYVRDVGPRLACPISAYGGTDDYRVDPAALDAWREHTVSSFTSRMFAGGHFFIRSPAAMAAVAAELSTIEEAMA